MTPWLRGTEARTGLEGDADAVNARSPTRQHVERPGLLRERRSRPPPNASPARVSRGHARNVPSAAGPSSSGRFSGCSLRCGLRVPMHEPRWLRCEPQIGGVLFQPVVAACRLPATVFFVWITSMRFLLAVSTILFCYGHLRRRHLNRPDSVGRAYFAINTVLHWSAGWSGHFFHKTETKWGLCGRSYRCYIRA